MPYYIAIMPVDQTVAEVPVGDTGKRPSIDRCGGISITAFCVQATKLFFCTQYFFVLIVFNISIPNILKKNCMYI